MDANEQTALTRMRINGREDEEKMFVFHFFDMTLPDLDHDDEEQ